MERRRLGRQAVHLGTNKEAFDAELRALYQSSRILGNRNEWAQVYTILSGSKAAIARARSDDTGPEQFAIVIIEVCSRLTSLALRWPISHSDIEGNEVANGWAKNAEGGPGDSVPRD